MTAAELLDRQPGRRQLSPEALEDWFRHLATDGLLVEDANGSFAVTERGHRRFYGLAELELPGDRG